MLLKILRDTVADGKSVKASDAPVEVSDQNARTLVLMGKAVPYEGEAPATPVIQSAPPPAAPVATGTEGQGALEDEIEGDPDLAADADELPSNYQELCEIAEEMGIDSPAKIKKDKLIELIKAKRAEA